MKYRKKPVIIEAARWFRNGDHPEVKKRNLPENAQHFNHICKKCGKYIDEHGDIATLEGKNGAQEVCPGDWIITGINGELYPCKPDIFEKTYEEVD